MSYLLALLLFCQVTVAPPRAYVFAVDPGAAAIATDTGRYEVELYEGCGNLGTGNVDYLPGSGGIVALGLPDGSLCSIGIIQIITDMPCATVAGVCDITADPDYAGLVP